MILRSGKIINPEQECLLWAKGSCGRLDKRPATIYYAYNNSTIKRISVVTSSHYCPNCKVVKNGFVAHPSK